ncbi:MAG TPA: DUF2142 domain-containing protein [Acidimicrobiia bacterium]|nr:DUF2142 domain-containing protein [Acidimicrobiia bacterium]
MRTGSFTAPLARLAAGLRSSSRRVWWTSFVLAMSLSAAWALSQPVFAGPDEPAHVVRAVALAHGTLTGSEPRGRLPRPLRPVEDDARVVQVPAIYGSVVVPCFTRNVDLLAPCLRFTGPTRDADIVTYKALQPPAYHGVVGAASWLFSPGTAVVYLMRLLSAVITGALLATAITALGRANTARLLAVGVVLAVTPMVLFLGGVVNPAGPEVAAAVAFWVCGLVLVSRSAERVENVLVTGAGVAGVVLALSRPLGPVWVVLVALTVLAVSSRTAIENLARSGRVRVWAALVAVAVAVQVIWDVAVRQHEATLVGRTTGNVSTLSQVQDSLGATYDRYREMIGWFGWRQTLAPTLSWVPWTVALGFLFLVALAWVARRHALVLLALLAAVIVIPIVVDATPYVPGGATSPGTSTLPLAVGIPILAAFSLAATERRRDLLDSRFVLAVGIVAAVAQFLAFADNLRRYTVGGTRDLLFFLHLHTQWQPPVPAVLLTVGYAALVVAFVAWLLAWRGPNGGAPLVAGAQSSVTAAPTGAASL